ncbi:unnamed protein product [Rotaria sp. Silwood2]|nr:unnamed protein product [Rotaria sp. Silwood2]CAF4103191.1 unnamed protein product [Rotaria sp. Silwood2]
MSYSHKAKEMCAEVDTSQYERIDMNQFRNWLSNNEILISSSCETSTGGLNRSEHIDSRFGHYKYHVSCHNTLESTTHKQGTTATSQLIIDSPIDTYSEEETKQRLAELAGSIYLDPKRVIIESVKADIPVTYEQRVIIQYLQPPALPPPGPIVIEEVRPPQPPPPEPLVIRQHEPRVSTPPPLILRERPPKPPLHGCSEKYIRELPPIPVPPRSVRIEIVVCLCYLGEIKIERWLPYGPQPEREIFIKRAPPAIEYPKPTHTVVNYKDVDKRIVRKFENLGVIRENPYDYKVRYGTSLLDSEILAHEAVKAGVNEDISSSAVTPLINTNTYGNTVHFHQSYGRINQGCSSSSGNSYKGIQVLAATKTINVGETSHSSSSSKHIGYSSSVDSGCRTQSEVYVGNASASNTNTKYYEKLNQKECEAYV